MDNGITYREGNGYLIPNIALSYETMPLGYYGMLRKQFLKEHRKITYGMLLNQELLYPHCLEIELQAKVYIAEVLENIPVGYSEEERLEKRLYQQEYKRRREANGGLPLRYKDGTISSLLPA